MRTLIRGLVLGFFGGLSYAALRQEAQMREDNETMFNSTEYRKLREIERDIQSDKWASVIE
jgi:hypothetical protein